MDQLGHLLLPLFKLLYVQTTTSDYGVSFREVDCSSLYWFYYVQFFFFNDYHFVSFYCKEMKFCARN